MTLAYLIFFLNCSHCQVAIRPCSIDFVDGGATHVPILGPMELKNCISVLFFIILPT